MNILWAGFHFLNVFMFFSGFFVNYCTTLLPKCVVECFRYGRANMSANKSSIITSIEVPKKWFAHFYLYAVILQFVVCATVLHCYYMDGKAEWLIGTLNFIAGNRSVTASQWTTIVATTLFCFHLNRRLYETLRVSVYSNTKMNLFHYILAYLHYTGAILCVVASSPLGSIGQSAGTGLGNLGTASVFAFLIGNYVQNRAHVGLANLRKGKDKKEDKAHKVPRGGMFELVSCPNYFGEIIIYIAMAALFKFRNSSWNACTLWVVTNQITSGIMNHKWYKETFPDYPKERKAVIPYVI